MPLTPQEIAAKIGRPQAPKQDYGLNTQIDQMPNSEKLTPLERGIYKTLPGVSANPVVQSVGGALSEFDKWLGGYPSKLLSFLDVGAEGMERTLGLASQMAEKDFNFNELKSAWYAGSLTADVANLPTFTHGTQIKVPDNSVQGFHWEESPDGKGQNITGLRMPTDLPGIGGLASARKEIQSLVNQGLTYKDALAKVKENYQNSLGALALRSQLYDTYFHVAADPFNYILPELAPIDALHARRAAVLEKFAVNAEDAAGITKSLVTHADELKNAIKAETNAQKAAELSTNLEEVTNLISRVEKGEHTLNTADKAAIMLTGGDPFGRRITAVDDIAKKVKDNRLLNLFQLTPASRAQEAVTRVTDNIGSNLVQRLYNSPNAIEEFNNAISRAAKGATGLEFGHGMLTLEGRSVQSLLKGADSLISKTYDAYKATSEERQLAETLSQILGESVTDVLKHADESAEALLSRLSGKSPVIDQMIQSGELSADTLKAMAGTFKGGAIPYNKDMYFATVLDQIESHAMQQAVTQFGVKARGPLTRWSDAVKAAESLAFLRVNPAYPIKNAVNNDMTMIARGVFGTLDQNGIDDFWKAGGWKPPRLDEGFSPAEISSFEKASTGADKIIQDALKGGNYGAPEKVKDFFQKLNLGKLDTAQWGRNVEAKASKRAFTTGYMEYLNKYAKHTPFQNLVDPATLDAVEKAIPGFSKEFDNLVKSSNAFDGNLDKLLKSNINTNTESVLEQVSKALGTDVKESLGTDILAHIQKNLPDAIKNNEVDKFVLETRKKINDHIDDLFNKQLENQIEHVKAQTILGGPQTWYQKMGDAQDMFWSAHTEHAIRTPEAAKLARNAASEGDLKKANALWTKQFQDDKVFFDRAFKRVDAYVTGMDKAQAELAKKGINLPKFGEVKNTFAEWKQGWQDFFTTRNEDIRAFFDAKLKGTERAQSWDALQAKLDGLYKAQIQKEDELMQRIDDVVASQIPDPQMQEAFMASRDAMAELRKEDKEILLSVRDQVKDLSPEDTHKVWNQFWQERQARYAQMRDVDSASRAIMQGDGKAANAFMGAVPEADKAAGEAAQAVVRQRNITKSEKSNLQNFIGDTSKILPEPMPIDLGEDMMAYGRSYSALDEIVDAAKSQSKKTPLFLKDLPAEVQGKVENAIKRTHDEFGSIRNQAVKYAEYKRDSALLNYNRRTNFDNMVSHVFPYGFWTTGSMGKWAIHSIDRPAMLTNYLRSKKFLATSGLEQEGQPYRVKGNLRVNLPFAPDWMGDQFVDPLRMALPLDGFVQPFEQMQQANTTSEGRTQRLLEDKMNNGEITQKEYQDALDSQNGPLWEQAFAEVQQNDSNQKYDAWDFATTMSSPHAPIMWAYNALAGHPEDIGPFAPLSRLMRNTATQLGVKDWNNSPYNVEAKIRKSLGLPAFDKFDDYRIDRAISDFAGTGEYGLDEIQEATYISALVQQGKLTPDQAKEQSEVYAKAIERSNQEYTGGAAGYALSLLGINVKSVPEGEMNLRRLQDDFGRAYEKYNNANQSIVDFAEKHPEMTQEDALNAWEKANPKLAKDGDALTKFFDDHPEYEARLGLFDKPEDKVKKFLIDQIWSQYNDMPKVTKDEMRDMLGDEFQTSFLDKNTRDPESLSPEQLSIYLKLMGGKPIGTLSATETALLSLMRKELTDPETANRVQVFYDTRNKDYGNFYELQNQYYSLDKSKRKQFAESSGLTQYWQWRRNFMERNPDLVKYLTDNPQDIERAAKRYREGNALGTVPTAQELNINLDPVVQELITDFTQSGEPLPPVVIRELERVSGQYNLTPEQLMNIIGVQQ